MTKPTYIIALLLVTGIVSVAQASASSLDVHVRQQKLTLYAERIPLSEVLTEIGRQCDIRIHFSTSADETVSADFTEIPFEMGLERLVRNYSHAFIYGKDGKRTEPVITALWIYTRNGDDNSVLSWSPEKDNRAAALAREPDSSAVHRYGAPGDRDPLQSMQAMDPLVRFKVPVGGERPPENPLLGDPHEAYLRGPE